MNIDERKNLIIDLYFNESKTFREIAKLTHASPKYIKQVLDSEKQKRFHDAVVKRIQEGKTIKEITIEFDLNKQQIDKIWQQYLSYHHKDYLFQLSSKIEDSPDDFLNACYDLYRNNWTTSDLKLAITINKDIQEYMRRQNTLIKQNNDLTNKNSIL